MNADYNSIVDDAYPLPRDSMDFSKIKIGTKAVENAVLDLGCYRRLNPQLGDKDAVMRAIMNGDINAMRDISNFFYRTSGIYFRLCRYMAYLYCYDWLITPQVFSDSVKSEKVIDTFYKALNYLDNFGAKQFFGEVALKVIKNGCYYGYLVPDDNKMVVQELPPRYCRSRFSAGGHPIVEFNMRFFDDTFRDTEQRNKMLTLFPQEFRKGYELYKKGKLKPEFPGDTSGWYLLDSASCIKFNINDDDYPAFIAVIPAIIDLDAAQDLDRKRMEQKLLKIIIQKMPTDKNGDLVFDVDEAQALHNNAVRMLGKAIGINVLTTFADVSVEDMSDNNTTTSTDELEKVERAVYNAAGTAQNNFNSDGNIALEKSILNDSAHMRGLVYQFEAFLNTLLKPFNKTPKKVLYSAEILPTTIYNYLELSKYYKEQTQMGFSKLLPQIALGRSQSSILATAYFENDMLDLVNVFVPPMTSSTMNAESLASITGKKTNDTNTESNGEAGRNEKPDDQKSEKTIANRESMN